MFDDGQDPGDHDPKHHADLTLPRVALHKAMTARLALGEKGRREVGTRAIVRTVLGQ